MSERTRGGETPQEEDPAPTRAGTGPVYPQDNEEWSPAFDAISDGISLIDAEGRILRCNSAMAALVRLSKEKVVGQYCFSLVHGSDRPIPECPIVAMHVSRHRESIEIPLSGRWFRVSADPFFDAGGNLTKGIHILTDITERKRAEEALEQSELSYHTIFDSANDAIFLHDAETGRILEVNEAACRMWGRSREELKTSDLGVVCYGIPPYTQKEALEWLRRAAAEGPLSFDWIARRKDGTPIWFENSVKCINIGGEDKVLVVGRDITERKRVEKELQQSEKKYRSLYQEFQGILGGIPDIVSLIAADLRIVWANEKSASTFGKQVSDTIGRYCYEVRHSRSEPCDDCPVQKSLRSGALESGEAPSPDGDLWEMRAIPLMDDQGKVKGVIELCRNITERKRAEQELRATQQQLLDIIEFLPDATFVVDRQRRVIAWNRALEELTGTKKEDFLGKGDYEYALPFYGVRRPLLLDLVFEPEADIKAKYGYVERRGTTLLAEGFVPLVRGGKGAYFWAVASPLCDAQGKVVGAIESVRDITERRQAEKVLRESEERFRELAELLPETVFETDREGKLTFANRSGFEQFKYTAEDLAAGVNCGDLLAPARGEAIKEEARRVLQGEEERFGPLELMLRRKDGSEFSAMVHANAIIREGKTKGVRGVVVDLTAQKRLEAQLLQAQKLEAIGTLAGGIAHDFNNILMAIQGRASLMAMNLEEKHPYRSDLRSIEELVGRAADLTRQLLGFARGGKYEVRVTDLNELITKNSELFGRTKKEVSIHRKLQEGLWLVEVDQGQMEQVFLNLYVNAGQAMPGGGDLYLETANVVIDETYVKPFKVRPGKYVKVTVTDTGIGMDEDTKARIFEPFFTTREMGRGTGLGLATVYGIVKNHGGIINVYSEKGHGTTFTVYLPASEKGVTPQQRKRVEVVKGTGTVLLVDDERVIRDVGIAMLEALGYRVFAAAQGEEAVRLYREHRDKIDLVILDMIMPGISGGETYDRLREINPKVKVLLSSGYSVNGQAQKILDRGCDGFIQKPFDVIMLSYKIKEILGE